MVSLGAGVYAEATLESKEKAKMGLDGGVIMQANIPDILKDLTKRKEELDKDAKKVQEEIQLVVQNINALGTAIQSTRKTSEENASTKSVS